MLTTIEEVKLFVQGLLSNAAPRSNRTALEERLRVVGRVIWLGVSRDTNASFSRTELTLRRGHGVVGDQRSGHSRAQGYHDRLVELLLSGMTSINNQQVVLVTQEDADYLLRHDILPYEAVVPGAQGENIRTEGFDLLQVPLGSSLWFISPDGDVSPISLLVVGVHRNALRLMVQTSERLGSPIGVGWFVAVFLPEA